MLAPLAFVLLAPVDLRATAQRNAEAFLLALRHRDDGYFERTFAPGFTQSIEKRYLDRATALAQIESGLRRIKQQRLTVRVLSAKPEGKGYVATVAWKGTEPATMMNRPATLTATWRDEQHWVPHDKGWALRSLVTSKFDRTIAYP